MKIVKYIKKPRNFIIYLMNKCYFNFLPDKLYLKIKYRLIMNKKLNLNNPKTFNEKLQWLKLYDRQEKYTIMVDKYEVKKYVSDRIGEQYIIPTIGIYNKFDEINFDDLPNQFVIKCTHDSGGLVICKDKSKLNIKEIKKKINKCLKRKYYYVHREWPYKNIKPKIIIEKYMENDNKELNDFKFQMFNGKLGFFFICTNREKNVEYTYFDNQKKFIEVTCDGKPNNIKSAILPHNYDKMVELAKILSKDITELRVDFYEIKNQIYFGELTFYDSAGFGKYSPQIYDELFGNMIDLSKVK